MIPKHSYVADKSVMDAFIGRNRREQEELLRIFKSLAESPYQVGEWRQKRVQAAKCR
jgi:hypothetical protein